MSKIERKLTATDKAALESYRFKCEEVKSFSIGCIKGLQTGLMLFGHGGNGKSYSIRETFRDRKITEVQPEDTIDGDDEPDEPETPVEAKDFGFDTWVNHQGRITPKGLVKAMAQFPQSLHLVEDAETIFDDKNCWGVLRMALHSQDGSPHGKRRITWKVSTKDSYDFYFTGSLVIVGNRVLSDSSEIDAVKTRCPCLTFDISNQELIAKMKQICELGYTEIPGAHLTKDDCYAVLDFLLTSIEENPELKRDARGNEKKLNLRILISGFRFLALSRFERSINWRDMLLSQLKQIVGANKKSRSERVADDAEIAKEIAGKKFNTQHDKLVAYCQALGTNTDWSLAPKKSPEYVKGFNAAKTDFTRKNKK